MMKTSKERERERESGMKHVYQKANEKKEANFSSFRRRLSDNHKYLRT